MKQFLWLLAFAFPLFFSAHSDLSGRGFGGFRGGARMGGYGGGGYSARRYGGVVGPAGGYHGGGVSRGSYTTPRGTNIQYGGAGRGYVGPYGGAAGRAAGGVRVTTPGGRTFTDAGRVGGAVGPGGVGVAGGRRVTGYSGPGGRGVGVSGGRTAVGPYGAATSRYRGGVGVGPYGLAAGGAAGARVGGVGVRRGTWYASSAALRTRGTYVRNNFRYYNSFSPAWYRRYPGAWIAPAWVAGAAWSYATWPSLASYCGYPADPVYYDYGNSVVYENNDVYYNGEPVATAQNYAQQAEQIADVGVNAKPSGGEKWQSLGVFALVQGDEKTSYQIFQLAVDNNGIIRGNYYDALTDSNTPVAGSVDRRTRRAAWTVGTKKDIVYETGIANLTHDETPILVHFGKDDTQQFTFVRVNKQQENK